ncbi:MAG: sensor histidine kinase, partial [Candidatus Dormibacteria bacterium]
SNALKFSPVGAPIEVVVEADSGWARVSVTDHGLGITEDEQHRLFQPFSRLREDGGAGRDGGLGLGLFIARSLVDDQGGHIGVRSEPGAGSTFHFTLPLVP